MIICPGKFKNMEFTASYNFWNIFLHIKLQYEMEFKIENRKLLPIQRNKVSCVVCQKLLKYCVKIVWITQTCKTKYCT